MYHTILRPSTRRVTSNNNDNANINAGDVFDTYFVTKSNDILKVRVTIPPSNSSTSNNMNMNLNGNAREEMCPLPVLKLQGIQASHAMIDENTMVVTGYAPLRDSIGWLDSSTSLGEHVKQVVELFQKNPPIVLKFLEADLADKNGVKLEVDPSGGGEVLPPSYDDSTWMLGGNNNGNNRMNTDEYHLGGFPNVPRSFPELDGMNREELEMLLEDEEAFREFARKHYISKELDSTLKICEENVKVANENLRCKDDLEALMKEIERLKGEIQDKLEVYEPLEKRYSQISKPPTKKSVLKKLNTARRQSSRRSDDLSENFVQGDMGVNDYIQKFMKERILFHERAAKMERLQNFNEA